MHSSMNAVPVRRPQGVEVRTPARGVAADQEVALLAFGPFHVILAFLEPRLAGGIGIELDYEEPDRCGNGTLRDRDIQGS